MGGRGLAAHPKKARDEYAHLVLIDETGLFLDPLVRRSWAARGRTPVIGGDGGHRKKVSVIGGVSVSPPAGRVGLYLSSRIDGYFDAGAVVRFLRDLLRSRPGKVIVVWDGGPNQNGPVIRSFLERNRRVWLERLPPYAPQLNPVEVVWAWLKCGQLANFVPDDLAELGDKILDRLIRLRRDPKLVRSLWGGSDLPFPGDQSG